MSFVAKQERRNAKIDAQKVKIKAIEERLKIAKLMITKWRLENFMIALVEKDFEFPLTVVEIRHYEGADREKFALEKLMDEQAKHKYEFDEIRIFDPIFAQEHLCSPLKAITGKFLASSSMPLKWEEMISLLRTKNIRSFLLRVMAIAYLDEPNREVDLIPFQINEKTISQLHPPLKSPNLDDYILLFREAQINPKLRLSLN